MLTVESVRDSAADSGLLESARALFRRYGDFLRNSGGHQTFRFDHLEQEIIELPVPYTSNNGGLLVARYNTVAAGCAAFRAFPGIDDPHCCEIKRLFVAPEFRGHSIGSHLVRNALQQARSRGYRRARLDTDPVTMPSAHRLYLEQGFLEYHRQDPTTGTALVYLQKSLD